MLHSMISERKKLMGKHIFTCEWIGTQRDIQRYGNIKSIKSDITIMIESFEQKYSRFREESLVSNYNRTWVIPDDADFLIMMALWEEYRQKTHGYFSLWVGGYLEELGYGRRDTSLKHHSRVKTFGAFGASLQLDFWGIWKGFLIQKIASYFEISWVSCYMINGWGDILISQDSLDNFGPIGLQHPLEPDQYFIQLELFHGAVAGSGIQYRKRETEDWSQHHLIDPTTGKSSEQGIYSIFVQHTNIILADCMATALFVMPLENLSKIAKEVEVEYCIVFDDMTILRSEWFGD
jgi:thiamine biosynthesis lipoprotein